jgi:regulator of RNase E activity RraA
MSNPGSAIVWSASGGTARVITGLEPAYPEAYVLGPAYTVEVAPGDNLGLHHAIALAPPGTVLVIGNGAQVTAHLGDILSQACAERGILGVILDGAIRDRPEIVRQQFPVFHVGTSPAGPAKDGPASVEKPVVLRGTRVDPGDIVCADADGVAVVPADDWERVRVAITALEEREAEIMARIAAGETTVDIYGLKELS